MSPEITKDAGVTTAVATDDAFQRIWAPQGYYALDPATRLPLRRSAPPDPWMRQIEGIPFAGYGHSWVGSDGNGVPGGNAFNRVASRAQPSVSPNNALSGSEATSAARRINSNGAQRWLAGVKGVAWVDCLLNQLNAQGYIHTAAGKQAAAQAGIAHAVRSILSGISAGQRYESAGMTRVGTWTTASSALYSGGSIHSTAVPGDYIEQANVAVTAAGKLGVLMLGTSSDFLFPGAAYSITIDGGGARAGTQQNQVVKTTQPESDGSVAMMEIFTGVAPGNHTVRVTRGAGTGNMYVDAIVTRAVYPPPILLWLVPTMGWYGYGALFNVVTQDDRDAYNAAVTAIAADFPNVILVQPDNFGWDYRTMIGPDTLHPNDRGYAFLANVGQYMLTTRAPWTAGVHTGIVGA